MEGSRKRRKRNKVNPESKIMEEPVGKNKKRKRTKEGNETADIKRKKKQKRVKTYTDKSDEVNHHKPLRFHEMGLDDRILKAIAKLRWQEPTLIQEKAIPLALEGKDILARARTGSGKTGAFAIPLIQKVLQMKQNSAEEAQVLGLILTPSKELCRQIYRDTTRLASSCTRDFNCLDISLEVDISVQKPLLMNRPDVIIGTPTRVLAHLKAGNIYLQNSLQMLVIDEADLLFSSGHEQEMREIKGFLPQICQTLLMSATLTEDTIALKRLVLHNAVILKLQEPQLPRNTQLKHYYMYSEDDDKFVLLYAMFKLKLVRGKSLVFVKNVNRCYKLKLFLEQFGVNACILNGELPLASRCHIIAQFNSGSSDIIIASDEELIKNMDTNNSKRRIRKDKESGASRGIDFQFLSNVINFDFPNDINSYIHRVGRTARGNKQGYALSFVSRAEKKKFEHVEESLQNMFSEDKVIRAFKFDMSEVEGFRYRARDVSRSVTKVAIREARLKEIKQELVNSKKLKTYWEENPRDLEALKHDRVLYTVKHSCHLKHVPDYIVPESLKQETMPKPKTKKKKFKPKKKRKVDEDPLVNMEFTGFSKNND